tara:strand:+ start:471 stop:1418 length:948 start_codon:yes stop_codon:yes gene_type:complete
MDKQFTFTDLCAGIGGFRIGLQAVGGQCVYSAEWDRFARQTYEQNFGGTVDGHDVNEIVPGEVPDHDVLTCGFPCVSFSNAGARKGFDDPRTEVFWSTLSIVAEKRPKIVIFENVRGVLKYRDIIEEAFNERGYDLRTALLSSSDFGVPQNRLRAFLVGIDQSLDISDHFQFPGIGMFSDGYPRRTLADVLQGTLGNGVDDKYELSDRLWKNLKEHKADHASKGNGYGFQLKTANDISPTIPHRYYKDGSNCLIDDGTGRNPRRLTPREVARVMGFSDEYAIPVSDTQAYMQFGNAVCPPVVESLGRQIVPLICN